MGSVPTPRLPTASPDPHVKELVRVLSGILADHAQALNQLASGKFSQYAAKSATKPTITQGASPGDFVVNTEQAVLGTFGSQYITRGWIYLSDGLWHDINDLTDG